MVHHVFTMHKAWVQCLASHHSISSKTSADAGRVVVVVGGHGGVSSTSLTLSWLLTSILNCFGAAEA